MFLLTIYRFTLFPLLLFSLSLSLTPMVVAVVVIIVGVVLVVVFDVIYLLYLLLLCCVEDIL